jgi:hypothetical protein
MSSLSNKPKNGGNLDDFQALFMSLPKGTQQQLLSHVVKEISVPSRGSFTPAKHEKDFVKVEIEPLNFNNNSNGNVIKVMSNLNFMEP